MNYKQQVGSFMMRGYIIVAKSLVPFERTRLFAVEILCCLPVIRHSMGNGYADSDN